LRRTGDDTAIFTAGRLSRALPNRFARTPGRATIYTQKLFHPVFGENGEKKKSTEIRRGHNRSIMYALRKRAGRANIVCARVCVCLERARFPPRRLSRDSPPTLSGRSRGGSRAEFQTVLRAIVTRTPSVTLDPSARKRDSRSEKFCVKFTVRRSHCTRNNCLRSTVQ